MTENKKGNIETWVKTLRDHSDLKANKWKWVFKQVLEVSNGWVFFHFQEKILNQSKQLFRI